MHNLLTLALLLTVSHARSPANCDPALADQHRLRWTTKGLAEGLREMMTFARRGHMRETARVIDLRRRQWAIPTHTHFGEGDRRPVGIELDMTAVRRAQRTRRDLVLAHTHPVGGIDHLARELKVDVHRRRPYLALWAALPSVADVAADVVLQENGIALEQWVVSSRYVVAFRATRAHVGTVEAFELMSARLLHSITRVGPGEEALDIGELVELINAQPERPVRLRVVKRF